MKYILISEEAAFEIKGSTNGVNMLIPIKIMSGAYIGQYACNEGSVAEFADLFKSLEPLTKVEISSNEFLKNPIINNLSGYGVEIPSHFYWVFEADKFVLNEFEVPLVSMNGAKYIDVSYFNWPEFRQELDTKDSKGEFVHLALKRALMPLWEYVESKVKEAAFVEL